MRRLSGGSRLWALFRRAGRTSEEDDEVDRGPGGPLGSYVVGQTDR